MSMTFKAPQIKTFVLNSMIIMMIVVQKAYHKGRHWYND